MDEDGNAPRSGFKAFFVHQSRMISLGFCKNYEDEIERLG